MLLDKFGVLHKIKTNVRSLFSIGIEMRSALHSRRTLDGMGAAHPLTLNL